MRQCGCHPGAPLHIYSRSDLVTEFIPGRMSPHLGARGAGESSAIPRTPW